MIATKVGGNMHRGDPNAGGANRKGIFASCEASLRRLQTDYIDLHWMHWEDPFTPIEETIAALNALVEAGKVRYIGFSDTHAWKVARAQSVAEFRRSATRRRRASPSRGLAVNGRHFEVHSRAEQMESKGQ